MRHLMCLRKIGDKISLFIMDAKLLVVGQDIVGKVNKEHQLLDGREVLDEILLFREKRPRPEHGDEDLGCPHFGAQKHGHQPGIGKGLEIGLLHLVLNDTAVDVVEERLDDHRVAVWTVIPGQISEMLVKVVEEGVPMAIVQGET